MIATAWNLQYTLVESNIGRLAAYIRLWHSSNYHLGGGGEGCSSKLGDILRFSPFTIEFKHKRYIYDDATYLMACGMFQLFINHHKTVCKLFRLAYTIKRLKYFWNFLIFFQDGGAQYRRLGFQMHALRRGTRGYCNRVMNNNTVF
jgi:hypothetical protein